MDKLTLQAQKRTVLGRKVKQLRKEGLLPANVYGKKVKSVSITIPFADFEKIYKKAGETGLIELKVDGEVRPVLIHNIQYNVVSMQAIHADLYQVDLKEKVQAMVKVEFVGQAPAVTSKTGVLLTMLDEVEVEALPANLPEKIEISVESLAKMDQTIKVGDIKVSKDVKILTPADREVVKVAPLVSKAAEKMAAEEQAAKAAAAAEAAAAEVPAGGTPAATSSEAVSTAPAADAKKSEAPSK